MGTRNLGNYEDLITFTRASGGTALRPVSYGTELVDTANTASSWTAYGTNTVAQDGDAVKITYADNSQGAFIYLDASGGLSSDFVQGKLYRLTAEAKINTGSASLSFYDGSATNVLPAVSSTTYVELGFNFVFSGSNRPFINTSGLGSGEIFHIKSVSVKEVTFDDPYGDLTLFEHPVDVPRVEWDANGNRLGLLVEEARTNLIPYSEDFSNSAWGKNNSVAVSASSVASPDGQQNAYEVTGIESSDGDVGLSDFVTASASTTYTGTLWFKAKSASDVGKYVRLRLKRGGGAFVSTNTPVQLTSDWVRHEVTITLLSDNTSVALIVTKDTTQSVDDRADECLIFGAQLEEASFPTSYIKSNSGSTTTRSADVASIKLSDFGFNYNALTLFVEAQRTNSDATFPRFLHISDDNVETIEIIGDTDDDVRMYARDTGGTVVVNADIATGISIGDTFKAAFAMKQGDAAGSGNGATPATDTDGFVMGKDISDDALYLGSTRGTTQFLTGYIKQVKVYPRRLTNAQLQALTEPRSTPTLSLTFDGLESSYTENYIHG